MDWPILYTFLKTQGENTFLPHHVNINAPVPPHIIRHQDRPLAAHSHSGLVNEEVDDGEPFPHQQAFKFLALSKQFYRFQAGLGLKD